MALVDAIENNGIILSQREFEGMVVGNERSECPGPARVADIHRVESPAFDQYKRGIATHNNLPDIIPSIPTSQIERMS